MRTLSRTIIMGLVVAMLVFAVALCTDTVPAPVLAESVPVDQALEPLEPVLGLFGGSNFGTEIVYQFDPGPDPYEPDNTPSQANWIHDGLPQRHSIVPVGDVDWVKFSLSEESEVVIETSGPRGDTRMWLYDSGLNELEINDDSGSNLFSRIDRLCGTDALLAGTYYVKIDEYKSNDEIPSYNITFTVLQPCGDGSLIYLPSVQKDCRATSPPPTQPPPTPPPITATPPPTQPLPTNTPPPTQPPPTKPPPTHTPPPTQPPPTHTPPPPPPPPTNTPPTP